MNITETIDGGVSIAIGKQAIMLNSSEAFDLLCWLADRKATLFARVHHLQHVPESAREEIETWREVIAEEREQAAPARADKDGEPFLEDCEWCHGAHYVGQVCPLNPNRKLALQDDPQSVYAAMEAALQLLTANILSLRTELLAIKAEVLKDGDQAGTREW